MAQRTCLTEGWHGSPPRLRKWTHPRTPEPTCDLVAELGHQHRWSLLRCQPIVCACNGAKPHARFTALSIAKRPCDITPAPAHRRRDVERVGVFCSTALRFTFIEGELPSSMVKSSCSRMNFLMVS